MKKTDQEENARSDRLKEDIFRAAPTATEERISDLGKGSVVLVAQDTTSVNYSALETAEGLGPIGTTVDGAQGLHLHSSLAMTKQGVPLGFVDAQSWARDPQELGRRALRLALPIEDKESWRWIKGYRAVAAVQKRNPHIQLVSVADREADIYELFEEALREPDSAKLLVRAKHNRKLQDEQERLFETIRAKPVVGYQSVQLPRQHNRASTTAPGARPSSRSALRR